MSCTVMIMQYEILFKKIRGSSELLSNNYCLDVSCKVDQITSKKWSASDLSTLYLQVTAKQWLITLQQFTH